jgi:hypothetical protein
LKGPTKGGGLAGLARTGGDLPCPSKENHRTFGTYVVGVRRAAALACALTLVVGACAGGDDEGDGGDGGDATESGCPVEPGRVGELLGYDVVVADDSNTGTSCRFVPLDGELHPGAHVIVVERRLASGGYAAALDAVESQAGPTEALPQGSVGGIDDGWVARLGRVVQVGAARDRRLVQVTVADADLDVDGAEEVAIELAREAIE